MLDDRCWCLNWPGPHAHSPDEHTAPCPGAATSRAEWAATVPELSERDEELARLASDLFAAPPELTDELRRANGERRW